jgi:hypothetical protein
MSDVILFFVLWLGGCALLFGAITGSVWFDRIVVFVLSAINAPVYPEARALAGLIYHHPEQWTLTGLYLKHPTAGDVRDGPVPALVYVDGPAFGRWEPTFIERRILFDAIRWWKRVYIRSLVHKAITL